MCEKTKFHNLILGECVECDSEEGMMCEEDGLTTETLKIKGGFWRFSNSSLDIEECKPAKDCAQINATQCEEGHDGPICANCQAGFARSKVSNKCDLCPPDMTPGKAIGNFVLTVSVPTVLILAFVAWKKRKKKKLGEKLSDKVLNLHDRKHWTHRLRTKAKIISSSFQIVCEFASTLRISFPPLFASFTGLIGNFVEFDIVQFGSFGCVFDANFHNQLLFYTIAPIVITVSMVVYYTVTAIWRSKAKRKEVRERRKRKMPCAKRGASISLSFSSSISLARLTQLFFRRCSIFVSPRSSP